jgi:sensor histidine kinase YesM
MRYVLYEGAKDTVLLQREIDFLRNYIRLMQIRYTDKVTISFEEPDVLPEKSVPPLLFITFVENAFKHGVSYKKSSFINVKLLIEGERIKFVCRNSKIDEKDDQHGGVGLQNVKQRLELIYDKNFTLDITDENDIYDVRLSIPML